MDIPTPHTRQLLGMIYEIVKRAPKDCPTKLGALGASALLIVASTVMLRMAVTTTKQAARVRERQVCEACGVRRQCKLSRAK